MPKKVTTKELLERAKRNGERARLAREEYDKMVMEENKALIDILLKSYEKNLGVVEKSVIEKRLDEDLKVAFEKKRGGDFNGQMEIGHPKTS